LQFQVKKYSSGWKTAWNDFLKEAKNSSFLFHRDFMEYHQNRFQDYSLIFLKENQIKAIFPANLKENILYSHQGLSYGGLVLKSNLKLEETLQVFELLRDFSKEKGFQSIYYKAIPQIYQKYFSLEEQLFFFQKNAQISQIDYNAVIDLQSPLTWQKRRLRSLQKAQKNQIQFEENSNYQNFWENILAPRLKEKYKLTPVHSLKEISYLSKNFSQNIKQYEAYKDKDLLAGITLFINFPVVHCQYSAASKEGLKSGALDFLIYKIIKKYKESYHYLSLGISNEKEKLNQNLWQWKEGFGAVFLPHFHYEIKL